MRYPETTAGAKRCCPPRASVCLGGRLSLRGVDGCFLIIICLDQARVAPVQVWRDKQGSVIDNKSASGKLCRSRSFLSYHTIASKTRG
jgi:hypothetical protein